MPEETLKALSDHGQIGPIMAADGGDCEAVLEQFVQAGVDVDALATRLQDEGAKSFVKSYPTVTPEQTGDGVITIIGCRCR